MNSDWNFGNTAITRAKIHTIAWLIIAVVISACSPNAGKQSYDSKTSTANYTDTLAETHTFLGANIPLGNIQLGPQTEGIYKGTGYHYRDTIITGFLLTHTTKDDSSHNLTSCNSIRFFPATDIRQRAAFIHAYEVVKPGYYSVYMHDNDVAVELTATRNVALQRYFFPPKDSVRVIIDKEMQFINDTVATIRMPDAYYVIHFSQPPKSRPSNTKSAETILYFDATDEDLLYIKAGISFENTADAERKIKEELSGWDFEQAAEKAEKAWK